MADIAENRIAENLRGLQARIADAARRVGREPSAVSLLAVSKRNPPEAVRDAFAAGQVDFGENYVQELLAKQDALSDLGAAVHWHYIGHLQRNKVRQILGRTVLLHAVDSERLLDEIDARGRAEAVVTRVLLQVNVAREDAKSGCEEADLPALARHALSLGGVQLRGLMTMPPFFDDPEDSRPFFRRLRELRDALVSEHGVPSETLIDLSMGMSNDFEVAIEEGATLVRVGTSIFGERG